MVLFPLPHSFRWGVKGLSVKLWHKVCLPASGKLLYLYKFVLIPISIDFVTQLRVLKHAKFIFFKSASKIYILQLHLCPFKNQKCYYLKMPSIYYPWDIWPYILSYTFQVHVVYPTTFQMQSNYLESGLHSTVRVQLQRMERNIHWWKETH